MVIHDDREDARERQFGHQQRGRDERDAGEVPPGRGSHARVYHSACTRAAGAPPHPCYATRSSRRPAGRGPRSSWRRRILPAARTRSTPASVLILGVYGVGSLICHQLPERSYHLWAAQMPVCARCAGIYFGAACGGAGIDVCPRHRFRKVAPRRILERFDRSARSLDDRSDQQVRAGSLRNARVLLGIAAAPDCGHAPLRMDDRAICRRTRCAPLPAFRIGLVVAWLVVAAADNQVN